MNLFLTGVTGYVGGSIARELVQAGHIVRGLIRDPTRTAAVEALGIVPVVGTLDDAELLLREARSTDGVVNAADSMHRAALEALIKGCVVLASRFCTPAALAWCREMWREIVRSSR